MDLIGWRLHAYWLHLLGCLVFWALLCVFTPVNRVAAFVFSFSALFALVWALVVVLFLHVDPDPYRAAIPTMVITALPLTFFGYCALSSPFYFASAYDVDVDATRFIRWAWLLLPAHLYHLVWLAGVESSLPPVTGG
jgi:hypothetical protein